VLNSGNRVAASIRTRVSEWAAVAAALKIQAARTGKTVFPQKKSCRKPATFFFIHPPVQYTRNILQWINLSLTGMGMRIFQG
jgi:hypothetical protein